MWLCVNFCGHPRFNFLICLILFGGVRLEVCDGICFGLTKNFFLNGTIFFWKPLESLTCIAYHKNLFYKWFCRKFPGFSKISNSLGFHRSNLFFDQSKRKRKNPVLRLKLSGYLNSFLDSSQPIENCIFKTNRNQITVL